MWTLAVEEGRGRGEGCRGGYGSSVCPVFHFAMHGKRLVQRNKEYKSPHSMQYATHHGMQVSAAEQRLRALIPGPGTYDVLRPSDWVAQVVAFNGGGFLRDDVLGFGVCCCVLEFVLPRVILCYPGFGISVVTIKGHVLGFGNFMSRVLIFWILRSHSMILSSLKQLQGRAVYGWFCWWIVQSGRLLLIID